MQGNTCKKTHILPYYFLGDKERSNSFLLPSMSVGPSLYYVNKETWWVGSEKWQFLLTFSTIYADVGWVGGSEKVQKCADVV